MLRLASAALTAATLALALLAAPSPAQAQSIDFDDPATRDAFREAVRAYLLEEPEIITEALQELERRRMAGALGALSTLVESGEIIAEYGASADEADLILVEFTDYDCPFCRRAQPELAAFIEGDPAVRHVVKALPYIGPDLGERAVLASLAQGDRAKTDTLHRALMSGQGRLDEARIFEAAAEAGFDVDRLRLDMASPLVEGRMARNVEVARSLRIDGTPAFVLGRSLEVGEVLGGLRSRAELAAAAADIRAR